MPHDTLAQYPRSHGGCKLVFSLAEGYRHLFLSSNQWKPVASIMVVSTSCLKVYSGFNLTPQ